MIICRQWLATMRKPQETECVWNIHLSSARKSNLTTNRHGSNHATVFPPNIGVSNLSPAQCRNLERFGKTKTQPCFGEFQDGENELERNPTGHR
jgi:hypothetical protein